MQAANPEEHLPLEVILEALHDEEYLPPPFFRSPKVPLLDFHASVVWYEREPRRIRRNALPPRS